MVKYFFDSFAIIELIIGNPNYAKYIDEEATLTLFNLVEIYYSALNNLDEQKAEEIYNKYKEAVVEVEDNVLKEAIKFRKKHKKANLSYTDCIGYIYAISNDLKFLTGDKQFKDFENVEFVPK
jgi:predicted nucleic acid-binding protein